MKIDVKDYGLLMILVMLFFLFAALSSVIDSSIDAEFGVIWQSN
jgi:hypothetical protein